LFELAEEIELVTIETFAQLIQTDFVFYMLAEVNFDLFKNDLGSFVCRTILKFERLGMVRIKSRLLLGLAY
jgi:hypothetical protein